jgi:hypothetical protein
MTDEGTRAEDGDPRSEGGNLEHAFEDYRT